MNKPSSNAADESRNAGDDALDMLLADDAPASACAAKSPIEQAPAEVSEVAAPAPPLDDPPALARLDAATSGLLMRSESDEPFRTVYWPLDKNEITNAEVALYLTENADASVQTTSVKDFFKNATKIEDWMGDDEKADAQKFADLVETIDAQLDEPRVYLVGEREITAAVIGKVAGGFAGVVTLVVET